MWITICIASQKLLNHLVKTVKWTAPPLGIPGQNVFFSPQLKLSTSLLLFIKSGSTAFVQQYKW